MKRNMKNSVERKHPIPFIERKLVLIKGLNNDQINYLEYHVNEINEFLSKHGFKQIENFSKENVVGELEIVAILICVTFINEYIETVQTFLLMEEVDGEQLGRIKQFHVDSLENIEECLLLKQYFEYNDETNQIDEEIIRKLESLLKDDEFDEKWRTDVFEVFVMLISMNVKFMNIYFRRKRTEKKDIEIKEMEDRLKILKLVTQFKPDQLREKLLEEITQFTHFIQKYTHGVESIEQYYLGEYQKLVDEYNQLVQKSKEKLQEQREYYETQKELENIKRNDEIREIQHYYNEEMKKLEEKINECRKEMFVQKEILNSFIGIHLQKEIEKYLDNENIYDIDYTIRIDISEPKEIIQIKKSKYEEIHKRGEDGIFEIMIPHGRITKNWRADDGKIVFIEKKILHIDMKTFEKYTSVLLKEEGSENFGGYFDLQIKLVDEIEREKKKEGELKKQELEKVQYIVEGVHVKEKLEHMKKKEEMMNQKEEKMNEREKGIMKKEKEMKIKKDYYEKKENELKKRESELKFNEIQRKTDQLNGKQMKYSQVVIELKDILTGIKLNQLDSEGKQHNIQIQPGTLEGHQIQISETQIIIVKYAPNQYFYRDGNDLHGLLLYEEKYEGQPIKPFYVNGQQMESSVQAINGKIYTFPNGGFPDPTTGQKGNFILHCKSYLTNN